MIKSIMQKLSTEHNAPDASVKKPLTSTIWIMPAMTLTFMALLFFSQINPVHWKAMLITLAISAGFASLIQIFWSKLRSLGAALLLLFLPLFLIGKYLQFAAPAFAAILTILSLYNLSKIRKLNFKYTSYLTLTILAGGIITSLILLQRSGIGYAQPFTSLSINKDTLFHVAISSMIKNYGVSSTGLHGLVPIHYHIASHSIFATISLMSELSIFDVYAYIYPLVLVPLMISMILCLAEEISPTGSMIEWVTRVGILTTVLIGVDSLIFSHAAFWMSFYESESYTLALILLIGLISLILKRTKIPLNSSTFINSINILLLFLLTCLAKISVGFVFFGILGGWLLFEHSEKLVNRIYLIGACSMLFLVAYKQAIGALAPFEFLHFIKTYSSANTLSKKILLYATFHLLFSNIAIISFILNTTNYKESRFPTWLIIGVAASAIAGSIPGALLAIPAGSAYYFSNVSQIIALPILVILTSCTLSELVRFILHKFNLPFDIKINIFSKKNMGIIFTIFFLLFYFKYAFLPASKKIVHSTKVLIEKMKQTPVSPYDPFFFNELKKISRDPTTKNMMIYLPRNVQFFWILETCDKISFIIPAIAERSALRGLPAPECGATYYGYEEYNTDLFKHSQSFATDDLLLKEARVLGFNGVIVLTEKGSRIVK